MEGVPGIQGRGRWGQAQLAPTPKPARLLNFPVWTLGAALTVASRHAG